MATEVPASRYKSGYLTYIHANCKLQTRRSKRAFTYNICTKILFSSILLCLGLKTCQSCQILSSLDTSPICQAFPVNVTPFGVLLRVFLRKLVIYIVQSVFMKFLGNNIPRSCLWV